MIFWLLIPVALALGALGRRIAGGVLNTWAGYDALNRTHPGYNFRVMGDTPARLIYGATVGLAALLGGAVWWLALGGQEMPPNNLGGVGNGRPFSGLEGGSEWGEALWGGAVALGTYLAFAV